MSTDSTVILGAGIIGVATAFYLSEPSSHSGTIHLVEAAPELFASASGKAGGLVAEDWFGPATAELGELSFRLHQELATKYDGRKQWGYARTTGTSVVVGKSKRKKGEKWLEQGGSRAEVAAGERVEHYAEGEGPGWMRKTRGGKVEVLSEEGGMAQVDPKRLCGFLLEKCLERGVELHQPARAKGIERDDDGAPAAMVVENADGEESSIPCTRLLITAGAWTSHVFSKLFPDAVTRIPVSQLAGYSLVVRSPRWTAEQEASGCHAVFASASEAWFPEIFSRMGEEIYIAGLNDPGLPVPDLPTNAKVDTQAVEELRRVTDNMIGDDYEVIRQGICFRPVTRSGNPILARIPDDKLHADSGAALPGGVFLCAGHGPWGISLSLGTGKVMSEMLLGQKLSCNVSSLGLI
ncbi:putative oxidoreductase [Cercospora beticola]|uniref:Putative oxidoreductase n=1 Tax=Cercospora beticola TaxID=122368 RepID=A0A2G5HYU5_CERBT|nr:putative oxidoreductase [Cercospora beticola]PIA97714.1 putative oxidoreductase [Cercospora beticola]WPA99220.1 hypothetical protein RHO25_003836 [Cercospora beticola]CAK1360534.1 unnamed protein product [Cercospora beticola]